MSDNVLNNRGLYKCHIFVGRIVMEVSVMWFKSFIRCVCVQ